MKKTIIFLLTCATFFGTFCTRNKSSQNKEVREVIIDKDFQGKFDQKFRIVNASLEGDILSLEVQCSGCGNSVDFNLINNGVYLKSFPPGTVLSPVIVSRDDAEREITTGIYKFDVSPIRHQKNDSVFIIIDGYGERLLYKY